MVKECVLVVNEEKVSTVRPEVDAARPNIDTARLEVHTANAPVSTTGVTISTADPEVSVVELRTPPTATSIFDNEDITMAQTLEKMKEEKTKEKGNIEEKAAQEEGIDCYNWICLMKSQAGIDADRTCFAAKLPIKEEREKYTIEERAKFLAETIAAQRKFRAAQRAAEIRSRPPTKSQLRNLMMTYLKNMGGYKHSQLKAKTFKEIQTYNCGVHTLTLEDCTMNFYAAKRKYPLTKETLERMMFLKLIAKSESDSAYDLLRFIQKKIDEAGSYDGGREGSLSVGFITIQQMVITLAIPEQTTTGKETSNQFMAGSLPKTTRPT
ncbi:hypothetical protein Tco_0273433 [Tanacetum coccineum]